MKGHYSDVWQAVAAAVPDRPAIVSADGECWTYRRFAAEAGAVAAHLADRRLGVGDTVALLLHNRPEFLITLFACLASGITPVPLNYRLRPPEIAALLDDSAAAALVYPASLDEVVDAAVPAAAADPHLIAVADDTRPAPGAR